MEIRPAEKLIITLLIDIHKANKINSSIDVNLIEEAIDSNNHWALSWQYPGLFPNEETPPEVREVCDILDMWDSIEYSFQMQSQFDRQKIITTLRFEPKFKGFDGNSEYRQLGIIDILVNKLDRYQFINDRYINSHMPSLETYKSQVNKYKEIVRNFDFPQHLTTENIIEIIKRAPE